MSTREVADLLEHATVLLAEARVDLRELRYHAALAKASGSENLLVYVRHGLRERIEATAVKKEA